MTPPPSTNKNRKPGLTAKGDQRQYVRHSYQDRSSDTVRELTTSDENTLRLYQEDSVGGPFPLKLQIVLKVTEKLGQQHIISWLPHGRSFMIHRPREFEAEIMGKFFKQTKLTSFRRQLNLYDFQRITHGRDAGSYYHELFLRGRPLLAKRMVRRKVKGTKIRASSSPDDEPNFYKMTPMEPLNDVPGGGNGMGAGVMGQDPTLGGNGIGMGGNGSSLSNFNGVMPGPAPNGMMNPQDPNQFNRQSFLQQQQSALASLQHSPSSAAAFQQQFQQNAFYSDLMNRMHLAPHLYGGTGGMNNLDYLAALQQRNALAMGFSGGYPNPYFQGDPSLLGLQGGAGMSPYNKSMLGAQANIGDTSAGSPYGNLAGNIPSMTMQPQAAIGAQGTQAAGSPSRVLMEQMNQTSDIQPNEEYKQNAVEQLLRLQRDQSSTPSSTPVGSKKDIADEPEDDDVQKEDSKSEETEKVKEMKEIKKDDQKSDKEENKNEVLGI